MRKILFLLLTVICFSSNSQTSTWDGGGTTNNWSEAANWVGDLVPTDGDDIIFNATSTKSCVIDVPIIANNFNINAGYTGTVVGGANDIVIVGNFSQAVGTFSASSSATFFQNEANGTNNNITKTGGVFSDNGGVVELNCCGNSTITIVGTFTFNTLNLNFNQVGNNQQRNFNFGTTSRVANLSILGSKLMSYVGTINITNALTLTNSNAGNPTGSTATFSLSGASNIAISGPVSPGQCKLPNIVFNMTGTPSMSGNLSLSGNWTNTASGNMAVTGTSTVNLYGASASIITHTAAPSTITRRAKFHNLTIHAGANVSMGNRHWIEVSRNLTINGTLSTTSQSGIHFEGSNGVTQTLGGTSSGLTIGAILKSNNTSTVSCGFAVTVLDSVKFAGVNGRINTNGNNFTLRATSTLKARISATGNGATASVGSMIGNIRVETFAPGGSTGWTNLGISGVNGNTVGNWDGQFPMTCNGCINPTTSVGGGFASITHYNEALSGGNEYVTANSSDALSPGRGLWVYLGTGQLTTTDITTTVTGSAVQGTVTIPITNSPAGAQPGFNLVANPFPCPIKWTNVMAIGTNSTNLTNVIHIYNPDLGLTSSFSGVTGITTPAASGATNVIPTGQAFYVETSVNKNLVFTERAKCNNNTSANQLLRSSEAFTLEPGDTIEPVPTPDTYDVGQYFRLKITGFNGDYDDAVIHFHNNADVGFDIYDAHKMFYSPGYVGYPGPYNKYTTISTRMGSDDLSINSLKPSSSFGYSIPVLAKVMQTGNYNISPIDLNNIPSNVCVNLFDKVTNTNHDLRTGSYNCVISDTTSAPRFVLTVCAMMTTGIDNAVAQNVDNAITINKDAKGVFVNFDFEKSTNANISVTNVLGQKIMDTKKVKTSKDKIYLDLNTSEQLIFVTVETENEKVTKKFLNFN